MTQAVLEAILQLLLPPDIPFNMLPYDLFPHTWELWVTWWRFGYPFSPLMRCAAGLALASFTPWVTVSTVFLWCLLWLLKYLCSKVLLHWRIICMCCPLEEKLSQSKGMSDSLKSYFPSDSSNNMHIIYVTCSHVIKAEVSVKQCLPGKKISTNLNTYLPFILWLALYQHTFVPGFLWCFWNQETLNQSSYPSPWES